MDIKQVVEVAKAHLIDVLGGELPASEPPTLEEIWFDAKRKNWCVTLGIVRRTSPVAGLRLPEYKTVRITEDEGKLVSIRNREFSAA